MKKKFLYILFFLGIQFSIAQINEVGLMVGGANPIADVGGDIYVMPNRLAFGVLYRWNAHKRFSVRVQANSISLLGNDSDSKNRARKQRGFKFENHLLELSLGAEYYFSEFDMRHRLARDIKPYIYAGTAYFWSENLRLDRKEKGVYKEIGAKGVMAIPFGLGVKARVSSRFLVSLEAGARYTFTRNLDGSYPEKSKISDFEKFGNKNSNDWYAVVGVMFTYTFGEYPCYCW